CVPWRPGGGGWRWRYRAPAPASTTTRTSTMARVRSRLRRRRGLIPPGLGGLLPGGGAGRLEVGPSVAGSRKRGRPAVGHGSGGLLLRDGAIWPRDLKSLACAPVNTSGAAFDSFNVAAERQTGRY